MSRYGATLRLVVGTAVFAPFVVPLVVMFHTGVTYGGSADSATLFGIPIGNFVIATSIADIPKAAVNTLLLVALNILASVVVSPLVAYGLTKVKWRGRGAVFTLGISTMMLPFQVTMLPLYFVWDRLHLVGTFWPLIIPQFFGTAFFIFLSVQFLKGVPNELIEAAEIDGASTFQTFWRIVLPQLRPLLAIIATIQFTWTWTDFLGPLLYLRDPDYYTLAISLYSFFGQTGTQWGPLLAACTLFALPAIAVFAIGQKYFFASGMTTGMK